MIGILLALTVAFLKSLGELAGKLFTDIKKKNSLDEYSLVLGARVLSVVLLSPLIFFLDHSILSIHIILLIALSSFFNAIANITAIKAVKHGDLSLVSPLSAMSIPFLLISGYIILGEQVNIAGIVGVGIIFFGTYFLNVSELKNGNILSPLTAIYTNLGARYMLFTALIWSLSSPLDKIGVLEMGALAWMLYTNIIVSIFIYLYVYFLRKDIVIKNIFQTKNIKKISTITVLGGLAIFLQMLALAYTLVVYVIALKRASGMFSVLLGAIFFKEKDILTKFISAVIIFAGVLLITIMGNI